MKLSFSQLDADNVIAKRQKSMSPRANILVIEDQGELANLISMHLKDAGFSSDWCGDGRQGLARAETRNFSMIILDVMLPGISGIEICRRLREKKINTPILMLTSCSAERDRVQGLEIGADDYVTKPFSFRELIARVNAILRRLENARTSASIQSEAISIGKMKINVAERFALVHGRKADLTAREFDLLLFFARHPGRVFTRSQLLDAVWGEGFEGYEHTVNSHINRLRSKIEPNARKPLHIETVWGVGYRMKKPEAEGRWISAA